MSKASFDTAMVFMDAMGKGDMDTFALQVKVRDGQVVLWNWFEDSYAVSQAYHG